MCFGFTVAVHWGIEDFYEFLLSLCGNEGTVYIHLDLFVSLLIQGLFQIAFIFLRQIDVTIVSKKRLSSL